MAKYYYNGVLLPEIPQNVLTQYPYCWINASKQLIVAAYPWYHSSAKLFISKSAYNARYGLSEDGEEWVFGYSWTDTGSHGVSNPPIWSSHDIPDGSATATAIYFYSSKPTTKAPEIPYEYTFNFNSSTWKSMYPSNYTVVDGATPFYTASTYTYDGKNTLRSGSIGDNGTSTTTINFTILDSNGSIEFNYKVGSEQNYDWLTITLDGTQIARVSGTTDWTVFSQNLDVGNHILEFKYTKDGSQSKNGDVGAIGYLKIVGMMIPYDKKYLIRCDSVLYTIIDNALTPLEESYPWSDVFRTYGFDEVPEWSIISELTNPELLYWYSTTDVAPEIAINMTAVPLSQNIITNAIDLTDPTITGIELMTVNCEGNPLFAVSFDNKSTWYAWNGETWSIVSEEFSGMPKDLLESVSYDNWMTLYTGASNFYIRATLNNLEDKLTEIYVDFAN